MNANLELITNFGTFLVLIFFAKSLLAKYERIESAITIAALHFLFIGLVLGLQVVMLVDAFSYNLYLKLSNSALVFSFATVTMLVNLIALEKFDSKKIKTLWKIPLIGILAGFYFESKYISLICAGYYGISLFVLWSRRTHFRQIYKALAPLSFVLLGLFIFDIRNVLYFNLLIALFLFLTKKLVSFALINARVRVSTNKEVNV